MTRARLTFALALVVLAGLAPASAQAKRSPCNPRGSQTVLANDEVRIYFLHHNDWACAYANGRRFEIGRGSEFFADGSYNLEHLQLVGTKVAYVISWDGVDYTVGEVWLRDVKKGRFLLKGVSPVVREAVCAPGDGRNVDSLVLAPKGRVAWGTSYSCAPGIASYRQEIVAFKPGGRPRLLDSAAADEPVGPVLGSGSVGLAEDGDRAYWMHDDTTPRSAEL